MSQTDTMTAREDEVLDSLRQSVKEGWAYYRIRTPDGRMLNSFDEAAALIEELRGERDKLREALKSAREWLPCIEPIMHDTAIFKRDLDTIDRALSLKETAP